MRRIGTTTRVIDQAIQTFFQYGQVIIPPQDKIKMIYGEEAHIVIIDPDYDTAPGVQEYLRSRFLQRLMNEHQPNIRMEGYKIILN